ncbi:MAG: hypothetical protein M4D80_04730 [Myxococcota bacterium]|nr:hypothetical protein [Deltaproteobacteria bacterium]MDQ3334443.1 hypothetical protein [Myxococcota bacterium]
MRSLVLVFLLACSSKQGTPTTGSGVGGGTNEPPATGCGAAKKKVGELYRAEAIAKKEKPERVEESISDNTAMVMNECVKSPDKVLGCINHISSASELEKQCLAQLDDEGSEGEALRK